MGLGQKKQSIELKFNYYLLILAVIVLLGLYLRIYHIQYPVIGYHNWKSTHYLTEARNFEREGFFKDGFFVPMRDTMNNYNEPSDGAHYDTFPTISIFVALAFKIFGESIIIARLVNIFFSLGAVIYLYFLIKELFNSETLALLTAFLAAINPLFVFFSHNIQVVNPGLFFMIGGAYYYTLWLRKKENWLLYLGTFFIVFSIITKYTYVVIVRPVLFTFPYKEIFPILGSFNYKKIGKEYKKLVGGIFRDVLKNKKLLTITVLIILIFPLWYYYSEVYIKNNVFLKNIGIQNKSNYDISTLIHVGILGDKDFWQTMKLYIADNFTLFGMTISLLGMIAFLLLFFTKNAKKVSYRFMFGYLVGLVLFLFIMGFKLSGHNYHQFPVAFPLFYFDDLLRLLYNI